jgi:hypothetical protein
MSNEQYARAAEFFEFARGLLSATLLALRDAHPGAYPELEAHRAQLEASVPGVSWAEHRDPSSTTAKTKP